MAEIAKLVKIRGQLKGQLTRFRSFINEVQGSDSITQLEIRLEKVEYLWTQFDNVQTEIESFEDEAETSTERELFENAYFEAISKTKDIINNKTKTETNTRSASNSSEPLINVKLPTLNLPIFNGSYEQWLPFYDSFNALIHQNKELADVQKFYYLKSCLKGIAAEVIQSLEASASNYDVAWKLLQTRFENKRLIVNNHVKALFEIPQVSREPNTSVRNLLDNMLKHLRALKNLKQPVEYWDTLIIHLIATKLDAASRKEWESTLESSELPTLKEFEKFMSKRSQIIETLESSKVQQYSKGYSTSNNAYKHSNYFSKPKEQSISYLATNRPSCVVCKQESHQIFNCATFKAMPTHTRIEEVKKQKLCLNCLRSSHYIRECQSSGCRQCNRKHNTLLHLNNSYDNPPGSKNASSRNAENIPVVRQSHIPDDRLEARLEVHQNQESFLNTNRTPSNQEASNSVSLCTFKGQTTQVLLSTAVAWIFDSHNHMHECRILLDSGSQSNFITKELCDKLQLNLSTISIPVGGINQTITNILNKTNATIRSRFNTFQVTLPFLVLTKITERLPLSNIQIDQLQIPNNVILADTTFHTPGKIDMLLGASIFWELLCIGKIKLATHQASLQKTQLGWIVTGNITQSKNTQTTLCHVSTNELSNQLEKFWKIEEGEDLIKYSVEEQECENHFVETHNRDDTGRFVVSLPFKKNISMLGDSKQIALRRLYSIEQRLNKQPELKETYTQFMDEYIQLGHMVEVKNNSNIDSINTHYLPHHSVIKESSTTTKLRVVFDGSCKTSSGVSINEILMVGPTIQQDIFAIILRFRQHRYVMTADIEKMYRQIRIQDKQQDLLRILWRSSTNESVKTFRLTTVTYGTASAPFQSIRCLHQLATENQTKYPEACTTILRDFYVDDLLTGEDTLERLKTLKQEISAILNTAGFNLRKWRSNEPAIVDEHTGPSSDATTLGEEGVKTLGLLWDPGADHFSFTVNLQSTPQKVTKRIILSTVAQIYDPLGLAGPSTIKVKILLQELWRSKCGWDESVPADLQSQWKGYYNQLVTISQLIIPRHILCINPIKVEVHAFCDASESAYGTCVYIKSINKVGNTLVRLLCAKSRVAPLKNISLPRLELCGALLLSRLLHNVKQSLTTTIHEIHCWSDSTVVLAWIAGQPCQWKTFVANRITEIQDKTQNASWRHVKSEDNPADVISRGLEPRQLANCSIWWNGPKWLAHKSSEWPEQQRAPEASEVPESKATFTFHSRINEFQIICRYSSLSKLKRVVAYCLRFKHNTLNTNSKSQGAVSVDELNKAMTCLVKLVQKQEFHQEVTALTQKRAVKYNSKLLTLNPFVDELGVIRVGGRLRNADIPYEQKYPIVLPSHHAFTELLIRHEHYKQLHAGAQHLLSTIRSTYWPLAGKTTVRRVLRKCIVCFRARPVSTEQLMGNLPKIRLTPARPFQNCGVDYAGPFNIKLSRNKSAKAYLCLFICLATKALHLELVSDLSTPAFLNALKRFISRRGKCSAIYSDNGSNFIGAKNKLNALAQMLVSQTHQDKVQNYLSEESISWHFIPPQSPHFGGLWEAGVKSVKTHLNKVLENALLTFEELYTVFTQIEACLNSRPLVPLSTDPSDFTALTPGHFLIGDALTAMPQESMASYQQNRLTRYQHLTQLLQHFWSRWSLEYLNQLQQRTKWKTLKPELIHPGTMVVLKDENSPPLKWKLGRIVQCFPGEDNIVRVVNVKTSSGVFKRPVAKTCILPIDTL